MQTDVPLSLVERRCAEQGWRLSRLDLKDRLEKCRPPPALGRTMIPRNYDPTALRHSPGACLSCGGWNLQNPCGLAPPSGQNDRNIASASGYSQIPYLFGDGLKFQQQRWEQKQKNQFETEFGKGLELGQGRKKTLLKTGVQKAEGM